MKALLWFVLALALCTNVAGSFALDGARQALVSVCAGAVTLGSGTALFLLREKHS